MKFKQLNILTAFALSTVIALPACSKNDGAIRKGITIDDVPAMTMNLEPQKKDNLDTIRIGNQGAFASKFKVAVIFPDQAKPTKVDIVVRKNGSASNVKVFKTAIADYPTSFNITAADITTLFGAAVALNDTYDFAPDIYLGDKKYEAFPITGAGNGSGVVGMNSIGYFEYVRITVKN